MTKQQTHKFKITLEFDLKLEEKEKLDESSAINFVNRLRDYCYGCYDFDIYEGDQYRIIEPSNVKIKLEKIK